MERDRLGHIVTSVALRSRGSEEVQMYRVTTTHVVDMEPDEARKFLAGYMEERGMLKEWEEVAAMPFKDVLEEIVYIHNEMGALEFVKRETVEVEYFQQV